MKNNDNNEIIPFENNEHRARYNRYFLPNVEIKGYNVMINGQNFFDQPLKILNKIR